MCSEGEGELLLAETKEQQGKESEWYLGGGDAEGKKDEGDWPRSDTGGGGHGKQH